MSYFIPVSEILMHVVFCSFFQDGLKTADKLKQYIEKLAADLYNVNTPYFTPILRLLLSILQDRVLSRGLNVSQKITQLCLFFPILQLRLLVKLQQRFVVVNCCSEGDNIFLLFHFE